MEVWRRNRVEQSTGLSRSSIYQKIADGEFPTPIRIGEASVGWISTEIEDWVKDRIAERDRDAKPRLSEKRANATADSNA
jgi:prophage regulatory protein